MKKLILESLLKGIMFEIGLSGSIPVGGTPGGSYWTFVYNKHRTCAKKM